jgi:hypothetical protein
LFYSIFIDTAIFAISIQAQGLVKDIHFADYLLAVIFIGNRKVDGEGMGIGSSNA